MYYVYLLLSEKDKRTYCGSTDNLARRLGEHNSGKNISTRNRRPLKLIYTESFDDLTSARFREKYFKSRSGRRELKRIFCELNIGE
ncbi:MAG: GIY-YIG nuclease family protein [Candidatus Doudnabacteria bacterium]|nr:GIY-YIG nuclease family protein [Candidatus Doudnabacteria bacterium]